jgi:hypothetical protein
VSFCRVAISWHLAFGPDQLDPVSEVPEAPLSQATVEGGGDRLAPVLERLGRRSIRPLWRCDARRREWSSRLQRVGRVGPVRIGPRPIRRTGQVGWVWRAWAPHRTAAMTQVLGWPSRITGTGIWWSCPEIVGRGRAGGIGESLRWAEGCWASAADRKDRRHRDRGEVRWTRRNRYPSTT